MEDSVKFGVCNVVKRSLFGHFIEAFEENSMLDMFLTGLRQKLDTINIEHLTI